MSGTIFLVIVLAAVFIAATKLGLLKKGGGGQGAEHWPVFPKKVLTPVEQQLYQRLNPLPNEAELRELLHLPAAPQSPPRARVFNLRDRLR